MTVLGIEDPKIWSVYVLCIVSALFCVVYSMANWNKGDESVHPEDVKWAKDEQETEEEA